jgi:hypothetical protein
MTVSNPTEQAAREAAEAVAAPAAETAPPPLAAGAATGAIGQVAANLFALILLGVSICAWVLFYTDLFPEVVGLLGLGGLFAWIAFLSNLLSESRKKELQEWFDQRVLRKGGSLAWIVGAAAVCFLGLAPFRGALVVSTIRDDKDRTIEIRSLGSKGQWSKSEFEPEHLPPRSKHVYSLPTPWWGRRQFQVKVSGLPARAVEIEGWHHSPLVVPAEFGFGQQPILLVHLTPEENILVQPPNPPGLLELFQNGKRLGEVQNFRGENVWVGGDDDIAIPEWMTTRWRLELEREEIPLDHLARWEPVRSLAAKAELRTGAELEFRFTPSSGVMSRQVITVAPPYPQEVSIDVSE